MILFNKNKNVILYNKIAKINTHICNNIFFKTNLAGPMIVLSITTSFFTKILQTIYVMSSY